MPKQGQLPTRPMYLEELVTDVRPRDGIGRIDDVAVQLRFNRSLQHRLVERSLEAHQGLRREFSIRGFCGVGC
jgi:hypothetical protein